MRSGFPGGSVRAATARQGAGKRGRMMAEQDEASGDAADSTVADAMETIEPQEASTPPTDSASSGGSRRNDVLLWGGVIAGIAGLVLVVLGVLAFSSASSDDDTRSSVDRERRALFAEQNDAVGNSSKIRRAGRALSDDVTAVLSASSDLAAAEEEFTTAMNAATDLYNNGNISGARAAYEAQGAAVVKLMQQLADVQQKLAAAHQRLATVDAGGGS